MGNGGAHVARGAIVVGPAVSFRGELAGCKALTVIGTVDVVRSSCGDITIEPSGVFIGSAEAERVDIAGRFEGDLVVRDRVTIRATGHFIGRLRYARLEVECGGEIVGNAAAQT